MDILNNRKLILGSKSPRRKELLEQANIPFSLALKEVEEIYPDTLSFDEIPEYLACLKADAFAENLKDDEIILCSDTIVLYDQQVLGKPKDRDHAIHILKQLSGNTHVVITGVCLLSANKKRSFIDKAEVTFYPLSDQEIEWYIDEYQPYDKAGAYGIQDWIGYVKIKEIKGTYATIMGLPIAKVYTELLAF